MEASKALWPCAMGVHDMEHTVYAQVLAVPEVAKNDPIYKICALSEVSSVPPLTSSPVAL